MTRPALPESFLKQSEAWLGSQEAHRLWAALETEPPVSIRANPLKVAPLPAGRPVPWCPAGRYLNGRPSFTLDPLFHGGAYYVQEASSMFVEAIYRSLFGPEAGLRVLDLCAAPGGKSTLLSALAGTGGLVVANEVIRPRAMALADNVRKWGLGNVVVTNNDPAHFEGYRHFFDLVLVDAPCSGEGMFRKTPEARGEWSPEAVALCAARDRRILGDVWDTLRPGGILIFSTCTFNGEENEGTLRWLTSEYGAEGVELSADPAWGVVTGREAGIPTFRFYPHRFEGEGFFAAVVRKGDERRSERVPKPRKTVFTPLAGKETDALRRWVERPGAMHFARAAGAVYGYYEETFPAVKALAEGLSVVDSGVRCGELYGGKLRPEHSLALFHELAREAAPAGELPLEEALNYLRKGEVDPGHFTEGINLVTYQHLPLGWIKRIGGRCNNLYPKELRIVNL